MRRCWRAASRACTAAAIAATTPSAVQAQEALIPAVQIDGRGHGHGVGMAQDGALTMGRAGADVKQILAHFYPGTTLGKAGGNVRVPVLTGNPVELSFPEGGEIRSTDHSTRVPAGGSAVLSREGDGTRVRTSNAPPPTTGAPAPSTTTSTSAPTPPSTTTTLLPVGDEVGTAAPGSPGPGPTSPPPASTTTTPPGSAAVHHGTVTVTPASGGRVGVTPRARRYRGAIEVTPAAGGALRFVNEVNVETYLRGMGEVRNPSWPAAGLQAQAIAARTYALRAMAFGGELCDTQRCQVYLGSDAEYAAMDKAVAATSGQVLVHGNSLASAVYSANAGGHTANREEGFGLAGDTHPYLRPTPYPTDNRGEWSVTVALSDVARRLNYAGVLTAVNIAGRGPSGRATSVQLVGDRGDKTVSGIDFDRALGLRSTLFTARMVMASEVASLTGGSVLQAPPEEAPAVAEAQVNVTAPPSEAVPVRLQQSIDARRDTGSFSLVATALWCAVAVGAFTWRRRSNRAIFKLLS